MKWKKKLTKKELKHIKETTNGGTLAEFKRNREWQVRPDQEFGKEPDEMCFECRSIARKLGLED